MGLHSGFAEEQLLPQHKSRREDLRLVSNINRRTKDFNYPDVRAEILRALVLVILQEIDALSEEPVEETKELKLSEVIRRIEAELIRSALVRTGGRQRRAARLLGVKVPTLIAKIKRYNINLVEIISNHSRIQLTEV